MPRWEVCQIRFTRLQGASWFRSETQVYQAHLFAPSGDETIIAESEGWEAGPESDKAQAAQFRALVAALGRDGWEPIPLVIGSTFHIPEHHDWYFKRQMPDEAR